MFDETQEKPLELLSRYRAMCEAAGAARATDTPLPKAMREQLARVEAELQTRLFLAEAEPARRQSRKVAALPSDTPARSAPRPEAESPPPPTAGSSTTALLYTDGACLGNPGPGGYCAIVRVSGHPEEVVSGGKARTTNNEMELAAAVEGLKRAASLGASEITVISDSEYLVKGMTGWIRGWVRNGWKTAKGEPVKNRALWEELYRLSQGRSVTWSWIRGHQGHPENETCDAIAVAEARDASRSR